MACRWSNELSHTEFRELQASAMAVDCTGMYALLAGRKAMAVVPLDAPKSNVQRLSRQSKWEVTTVQWNPHRKSSHKFSTACNQRIDIWSWEKSDLCITETLKAHTRGVTDLDWSPKDENLIATCSVDTYTYIWDLRECRKPIISLPAVTGASQVKWNKVNGNLIATAYDGGNISIWDRRKVNTHLHYFAGHLSKIHGLDWSHNNEAEFVTSSQDCSVMFWNTNNPRQSVKKLMSSAPVWRARYTPFGDGLLSVLVPQIHRSETSLFLWYNESLVEPMHTFVGHTDVVLDFEWRKGAPENLDYQLVTWSKDQCLRLWKIDQHLQKSCGHEIVEHCNEDGTESGSASVISLGSHSSSPSVNGQMSCSSGITIQSSTPVASSIPPFISHTPSHSGMHSRGAVTPDEKQYSFNHYSSTPPTSDRGNFKPRDVVLQQEFELVNFDFAGFNVIKKSAKARVFEGMYAKSKYAVVLKMIMPENYPSSHIPEFELHNYGMGYCDVNDETLLDFELSLKKVATSRVKHHQGCVEPCIRQFIVLIDDHYHKNKSEDSEDSYLFGRETGHVLRMFNKYSQQSYLLHSNQLGNPVPPPRTSGARFCGNGVLVCFTRPRKRLNKRSSLATEPFRGLSSLHQFGSTSKMYIGSNPHYELDVQRNQSNVKRISRSKPKPKEVENNGSKEISSPKKQLDAGPVIIYDISALLPINKQLAETYILDTDNVNEMCNKNRAAAAAVGRKDLEKTWLLLSETQSFSKDESSDPDDGPPWAHNPFGRDLMKSLIDYYCCIHDVQTLAMICCVLGEKVKNSSTRTPSPVAPECNIPYNPYHTIHPTDTTLRGWCFPVNKTRRSNSCHDINSDYDTDIDKHQVHNKLLNPNAKTTYNHYKNVYADILYGWGLLTKRAEILKYVNSQTEPQKGFVETICRRCNSFLNGPVCQRCYCYAVLCIICHLPVKGSSSFCLQCCHGGHSKHMLEWFNTHSECPTGCGCICIETNFQTACNIPHKGINTIKEQL